MLVCVDGGEQLLAVGYGGAHGAGRGHDRGAGSTVVVAEVVGGVATAVKAWPWPTRGVVMTWPRPDRGGDGSSRLQCVLGWCGLVQA